MGRELTEQPPSGAYSINCIHQGINRKSLRLQVDNNLAISLTDFIILS